MEKYPDTVIPSYVCVFLHSPCRLHSQHLCYRKRRMKTWTKLLVFRGFSRFLVQHHVSLMSTDTTVRRTSSVSTPKYTLKWHTITCATPHTTSRQTMGCLKDIVCRYSNEGIFTKNVLWNCTNTSNIQVAGFIHHTDTSWTPCLYACVIQIIVTPHITPVTLYPNTLMAGEKELGKRKGVKSNTWVTTTACRMEKKRKIFRLTNPRVRGRMVCRYIPSTKCVFVS